MIDLRKGDCLELMQDIPDKSIDAIIADLPYGTTACKWDSIIPLEPLWEQYKRIIKDNGAIVLTASQPFTTKLISSNYEMFRYEAIWRKTKPSNFMLSRKQILKMHENITVFYNSQPTFNPQKIKREKRDMRPAASNKGVVEVTGQKRVVPTTFLDEKLEGSIINITNREFGLHPTQKPVALMEYLIKTYTNEGETVLDNTMGSGTTGVACVNTNRNFIGMEMDDKYFEIAEKRINDAITHKQLTLF